MAGKSRLCRLFLSHRYSHCDAGSKSAVVFQCLFEPWVCLLHRSLRAFPALWHLEWPLLPQSPGTKSLTPLQAITSCAHIHQFFASLGIVEKALSDRKLEVISLGKTWGFCIVKWIRPGSVRKVCDVPQSALRRYSMIFSKGGTQQM